MKVLAIGSLVFFGFASACNGADKVEDKKKQASMLGLEVQGDAEVEKYDLDGDGKADVWKYFNLSGDKKTPKAERKRVLARRDMDMNSDSKVDLRQHYDSGGDMVREVMDHDFDGKFDATDFYRDGTLYKREIALNFREKPSIWKYYEAGKVIRLERDSNGDGKPDTVEFFEDGKLTRIGYDRDGDGKPDDYDEPATKTKTP